MRDATAKKVSYLGVLLALTLTLSILERLLPPLPGLPPGTSLGLSNIVILYCAVFRGARHPDRP